MAIPKARSGWRRTFHVLVDNLDHDRRARRNRVVLVSIAVILYGIAVYAGVGQ